MATDWNWKQQRLQGYVQGFVQRVNRTRRHCRSHGMTETLPSSGPGTESYHSTEPGSSQARLQRWWCQVYRTSVTMTMSGIAIIQNDKTVSFNLVNFSWSVHLLFHQPILWSYCTLGSSPMKNSCHPTNDVKTATVKYSEAKFYKKVTELFLRHCTDTDDVCIKLWHLLSVDRQDTWWETLGVVGVMRVLVADAHNTSRGPKCQILTKNPPFSFFQNKVGCPPYPYKNFERKSYL